MKTLTITLAFLAGLPLAASAQVSKEDIKKLTAAGISDDVILSYVKANGGVARLSAEDVVELKQAGASEKLLTMVLSAPPAAPAPAAPEPRTYASPVTSTYVYDSSPYYYTPSVSYASYYPYYYPSYYYSSCYPRSYYYSSCYPRSYYSYPSISFGFGFYGGSRYSYSPRGSTAGSHTIRR